MKTCSICLIRLLNGRRLFDESVNIVSEPLQIRLLLDGAVQLDEGAPITRSVEEC